MDAHRERIIISKLKSGDINALTPLITAYQQRAFRASYLVTQDQGLAEDVTQSAFVRAYESIHQFDSSRRFLPWFLRIVVNMSVKVAKKQARMQPLDEPESDSEETLLSLLADDAPTPESLVEMRELEDSVQALLESLSPDQRAVIVLRYYVDLTEHQMSTLLDVPAGTIKSRLYAARAQLRRLLNLNPIG